MPTIIISHKQLKRKVLFHINTKLTRDNKFLPYTYIHIDIKSLV